jgi:hypothetical protein
MNIKINKDYKIAKEKYMYSKLKLEYILPLLYEVYLKACFCAV